MNWEPIIVLGMFLTAMVLLAWIERR